VGKVSKLFFSSFISFIGDEYRAIELVKKRNTSITAIVTLRIIRINMKFVQMTNGQTDIWHFTHRATVHSNAYTDHPYGG
jgi:hypothetical protein